MRISETMLFKIELFNLIERALYVLVFYLAEILTGRDIIISKTVEQCKVRRVQLSPFCDITNSCSMVVGLKIDFKIYVNPGIN